MTKEDSLSFATIEELSALLAKRKISPVELTGQFLSRIERYNSRLNAFLTVTAEHALAAARRAEKELAQRHGPAGRRRPLLGIPITLKDNIWTRGIRTTAGSKVLRDFVPAEDATVVRKLARAGAILLGKTNLHEFAYGVTSNNAHYGPARNPWALDRIPGGSSGGSAVAIAAGLCAASVGTDTGGSIRIPSAMCGIVGLKPTFGRVSVFGTIPLAPSFDHVGPLARSVADAALLLGLLAGRDPLDPTSSAHRVEDFSAALRKPLRKFRLARANISGKSSTAKCAARRKRRCATWKNMARRSVKFRFRIWANAPTLRRIFLLLKRDTATKWRDTTPRTRRSTAKKCANGSMRAEKFWPRSIWPVSACRNECARI